MTIHKIDEYNECLISELSDETLKIIIQDKCDRIKKYSTFALWTFQDTIETIANWVDVDWMRRKAKWEIQKWVQEISSYVVEAQIRWISCTEYLQDLFWRKEKTTNISYLLK